MDWKAHISGVGNIVTNLQALESILRAFLVEQYGQCPKFPKMGDESACRNYLTAYVSLDELIDDYHRDLKDSERKFSVDRAVVRIRDALAHGRLYARGSEPAPPYELWKFARPKDGKVQVEFAESLTEDWLKEKWLLIDGQSQKVMDCAKGRGYKRLK
jgi:hypothetical protein